MTAHNHVVSLKELEDQLQSFAQTNENERKNNEQLDYIIEYIALYGVKNFKWNELRLLLQFKIKELCAGIGEENMNNEQRQLLDDITSLLATRTNGAPFTLQRICEIIHKPTRYYTKRERVLDAIFKCMQVPSTVEDFQGKEQEEEEEAVDSNMDIDTI
jgi:hypothetical protein